MRRAVNICCAGVLTLTGLSDIGIDVASAQIFRSNPSPASSVTQGNTVSALIFQTDAANVRFQINLKRAIASSVDNQTILDGKDLGPISIQSNLGSGDRIDTYQWSISPTSRLYLSPSGYKSLVAKYQYKDAGQSYTLNIFCQSRGIKQNKAACKLFGDGPLLNGETRASGQLAISDAEPISNTEPSSGSTAGSAPYRRGYELGLLDAKQKRERNFTRHEAEYDGPSEAEFRKGYDNGYKGLNGSGTSNTTGGYTGKGSISLYPTQKRPQEQRYDINRITLQTGTNATGQLTLFTSAADPTAEFKGKLEPTSSGQILTLSTVDGVSAQGKIWIGSNGMLRTSAPILIGADEQEVSLYFRPAN
jgi:hypothetical protein